MNKLAPFWSQKEERIIRKEYERGTTLRYISKLLESNGTPRTVKAVERKAYNMGLLRKYQNLIADKRVGHLDIETNGFNADFHVMLCWCLKENQKDHIDYDKLTPEDRTVKNKIRIDKRLTQSLVDAISKYDVIVTWYGEGFDLPFVRSRAIFHDIEFPNYGNIISIDAWRIARQRLKIHSNRLDSVAEFFGVNSKTKLDFNAWVGAVFGDEPSLNRVLEHNKQDVITLDKCYNRLAKYSAGTRKSV